MCGLVGMAGNLLPAHDRVIKMLLILDSLRGEDSSGVGFINKFTGNVTLAKALGDPFVLFNDGKYTKAINGINRVMIGHNRYATSGGVNKAGAHPFEFDTLVGAHNGTIQSRWKLDDDRDFKVDSQALYHNIEKNGLKESIRRLGGIGNAWSLVWWDKNEQTINFLRNKERPMFMCRSDDGSVLFWASESWMLDVALERCSIKHGDIFETEENVHYSVHVDNKGGMHKPKTVKVEAEPVVFLHQPKPPFIPGPKNTQQSAVVVPINMNKGVSEVAAPVVKKLQDSNVKGNGLASDLSYVTAKNRKLELLTDKVDGNGGKFITLFDPLEPYVDIRLYPHAQDKDLFDLLGTDIIGDITSFDHTDKTALRGYYKVSPWSVKRVPEPLDTKSLQEELALALAEPEDEIMVKDHHGRLITASEWKKHYAVCAWCDVHLDPLGAHKYTTAGDCLCSDCAKNPEVTPYVNLV